MLQPIHLLTPDGSPILSVVVMTTSRPDCAFERIEDQEDYKAGKCRLKWRILEPGDDAVIQIIYAGSARRDPTLEGTVEGQKQGIVLKEYGLTRDKRAIAQGLPMVPFFVCLLFVLVAALLFLAAARIHAKTEFAKQMAEARAAADREIAALRKKTQFQPISLILLGLAVLFVLGGITLLIFFASEYPGPPSGW